MGLVDIVGLVDILGLLDNVFLGNRFSTYGLGQHELHYQSFFLASSQRLRSLRFLIFPELAYLSLSLRSLARVLNVKRLML